MPDNREEIKKQKHLNDPVKGRIPWLMWKREFNHYAMDDELECMTLPMDVVSSLKPNDKAKAFLCSLIGHGEEDTRSLLILGRAWGLGDQNIGQYAAMLGRIDLFDMLWKSQYSSRTPRKLSPKKQHKLLDNADFCVQAALYGQLDFIRYIEEKMTPEQITAAQREAFYGAAAKGHFDLVLHFEERMTEQQKIDVVSDGDAFLGAAENGHFPIVYHLAPRLTPEKKAAVIRWHDYSGYRAIAEKGNLDMVRYIESFLSEEERSKAIESNKFEAFHCAYSSDNKEMQEHLLSYPVVVAWIASSFNANTNYAKCLNEFIKNRLACWRDAKNGVVEFNLAATDCLSGYYMAQHLIKTNPVTLVDDLTFLLHIPGIAALAPQELVPGQSLLQLAQQMANQVARDILLTLDSVRETVPAVPDSSASSESSTSSESTETSDLSGSSDSSSDDNENSDDSENSSYSSSSSDSELPAKEVAPRSRDTAIVDGLVGNGLFAVRLFNLSVSHQVCGVKFGLPGYR